MAHHAHNPRRSPHGVAVAVGIAALALGVWWLSTCSDGRTGGRLVDERDVVHLIDQVPVQPSTVFKWRRVRIRSELPGPQLEALFLPKTREQHLALRTAPTLVVSEDRDVLLLPSPGDVVFAIPEDFEGQFVADLGVQVDPALLASAPGSSLDFTVVVQDEGQPSQEIGKVRIALPVEGSSPWQSLQIAVSTRGMKAPRLHLANKLVHPELQFGPEQQRAGGLWAAPVLVRDRLRRSTPNVLILSVDTLRADHLGAWGYARDTSPNIDALLARGALFENATSPAPWTLPSFGSLFTGRYPSEHRAGVKPFRDALWGTAACGSVKPAEIGEEANQADRLAPDTTTLAEALSTQGYRTAAFVNNPFLHPAYGISRGFTKYAWYQPRADGGVDLALDWIDAQAGAPFFLFLHLMDPHMPYAPPAPWDTKFSDTPLVDVQHYPFMLGDLRVRQNPSAWRDVFIAMYDAEIAYTDDQIGRLVRELEARGLFDDTIVVFHSDHGEEFWEHGGFEHGHALHQEVVHVPLGIVWPGRIPAGVRVPARVRTLDVFPTVLQLLGLPPSAGGLEDVVDVGGLGALSLVPWIEGRRTDDLAALSETLLYGPPESRWNEAKARFDGPLKLIVGGTPETDLLYDLGADARETQNLAPARAGEAAALRAELEACRAVLAAAAGQTQGVLLTPAQIKALQDAGYTGTSVGEPAAGETAEDRDAADSDEDEGR